MWHGGGQFLFAGDVDQNIKEGECITSLPLPPLLLITQNIVDANGGLLLIDITPKKDTIVVTTVLYTDQQAPGPVLASGLGTIGFDNTSRCYLHNCNINSNSNKNSNVNTASNL